MDTKEEGAFRDYLAHTVGFGSERTGSAVRAVDYYGERWALRPADRRNALREFKRHIDSTTDDESVARALEAVRHFWFFSDSRVQAARRGRGRLDVGAELERLRGALRLKHRSYATERSYVGWVRRFLEHTDVARSVELEALHVRSYLSHLAVERKVAVATQEQAFGAVLFFYRHVLHKQIDHLADTVRSRRPKKLPVALTRDEVGEVVQRLQMPYGLMASTIYGAGLRLRESLGLRVQDLDFGTPAITVRSGKGEKDRVTVLPASVVSEFERHLSELRLDYENDRRHNRPGVPLPAALGRKYLTAGLEWAWFWVFPSRGSSLDPQTGTEYRWHLHPSALQRRFHAAVREVGLTKPATVHSLRHSFATHLIEDGHVIRTVQELLGRSSVQTTMIYTHVAQTNRRGVMSPLDR